LLASHLPVAELEGRTAAIRLQVWHRAILPGEPPEPFGLLLCIRETGGGGEEQYAAALVSQAEAHNGVADLAVDVGGGLVLQLTEIKGA
jgi:hypothetical protein